MRHIKGTMIVRKLHCLGKGLKVPKQASDEFNEGSDLDLELSVGFGKLNRIHPKSWISHWCQPLLSTGIDSHSVLGLIMYTLCRRPLSSASAQRATATRRRDPRRRRRWSFSTEGQQLQPAQLNQQRKPNPVLDARCSCQWNKNLVFKLVLITPTCCFQEQIFRWVNLL